MSAISDYRAERRSDRWLAAQIEQADAAAKAERRRQDQAHADQRRRQEQDKADARRAAQRKARQDARRTWFARLPDHGMAALWATMIVLPMSLAWQAQSLFAHEVLRIAEPANHAFPASIELAAWLCAFEAHRRRRAGESAGLLPTYMWSLTATAATINGAHGWVDGGPVAGLALAVMSSLGLVLHSARQGLDAARAAGRGHIGLALWRRVRYPRLSLAAASLRAARDLEPAIAWQLAWIDRYGVGPDVDRRERALARAVVKRTARDNRKAAREGDVTIVAGRVQRGFASQVQEHLDRERQAAMDQADAAMGRADEVIQGAHDALMAAGLLFGPDRFGPHETTPNPDGTTREQRGAMSQRAFELLPVLVQAVRDGALAEDAGAKGISKYVRETLREPLGMPVAMELRDRLRGLRALPPAPPIEEAMPA